MRISGVHGCKLREGGLTQSLSRCTTNSLMRNGGRVHPERMKPLCRRANLVWVRGAGLSARTGWGFVVTRLRWKRTELGARGRECRCRGYRWGGCGISPGPIEKMPMLQSTGSKLAAVDVFDLGFSCCHATDPRGGGMACAPPCHKIERNDVFTRMSEDGKPAGMWVLMMTITHGKRVAEFLMPRDAV